MHILCIEGFRISFFWSILTKKENMKQLSLILFVVVTACSSSESIVNLSEHLATRLRTIHAGGFISFKSYTGGWRANRWISSFNPKLFPLTNLAEPKDDDVLIKSTKTNKIYRASFKKGDRIYLPALDKD